MRTLVGVLSLSLHRASAWSCNDAGATEVLTKVPLAEVDALAVCNDGSEAASISKITEIHPFGWFTLVEADGATMQSLVLTALMALGIHTMIVRILQKPPRVS